AGSGWRWPSAVLSSVYVCVAATVSEDHHHARTQPHPACVLARPGPVLQLGLAAFQACQSPAGTAPVCGGIWPGADWRPLFGLLSSRASRNDVRSSALHGRALFAWANVGTVPTQL